MDLINYALMILLALQCNINGEDVFDCSGSDSDSDDDSSDESSNSSDQSGCTKLLKRSERSTENQESFSVAFTCESEGRFSDLTDSTCMRYFQCDELSNGTFSKKTLKCPNSTFCSNTQKCSSVYPCPCNTSGSTLVQTSFEPTQTTKSDSDFCSTSEMFDFDCNTVGRFPDYNDRGCQKYFLCSKLRNGTFIQTAYRCQNSYFDPTIKKCSVKYRCPCNIATSTSSTSTLTTIATTNQTTSFLPSEGVTTPSIPRTTVGCTISNEFECLATGRFPDFSDPTCRNYFLCSKLSNGTYIKTLYMCLKSTFNPLILKCSINYVCPCQMISTPSSTPTSSGSTFSEGFTKIPTSTVSMTTKSPYTCVDRPEDIPEFECGSVGRFPDYHDVSCRKYFLCSLLHNGTYVRTPYSCPVTSCMNPDMQKCSSKYVCPCSYPI